MTSGKAEQAALNNAFWCDAVCRTHGIPGEFRDVAWVNTGQVPRFYPNVVTLAGVGQAVAHRKHMEEMLGAGRLVGAAIKDSFQTLELRQFGFKFLFEEQWIHRTAVVPKPEPVVPQVRWEAVTDAAALADWEAAWSGSPDGAGIFLPALLADKDVAIIAAYYEDRIVAGAVASRAAEAVGLSNVFVPAEASRQFRSGCVARAVDAFPGLPLVGYEAGAELADMQAIGFEAVGPLTVWIQAD